MPAAREFESQTPQREKPERDDDHRTERQPARPLPGAVLEVIEELLSEDDQRAGSPWYHGVVQQAAAAELLAPDHGQQAAPVVGLRLVEDRVQAGADIEEGVDGDPNGGHPDRQDGERPRATSHAEHHRGKQQQAAQQEQFPAPQAHRDQHDPQRAERTPLRPLHPALGGIGRGRRAQRVQHEHRQGGPDEQREQVIADGQRGEIDDQQQDVRRARGATEVAPPDGEPGDGGDAERRHRVDLRLVAVLPVCKRKRGQDRCRNGTADAQPADLADQQPVRHQKETAGSGRGEAGAHQIGPPSVPANPEEAGPNMAHEDEQRCAWRMGDAEHLCGGDEFARVPQRDGGRQRDHIPDEHQEGDRGRLPVGGLRWQAASRARRLPSARRRPRADRAPAAA